MSGHTKVSVIDIGSNSVRLVVYDALKRAALPLYNEKAMCALGKGLAKTGKLNAEGRILAHAALGRYAELAKEMGASHHLYLLATAAVRDASDGEDFVREIYRRHHLRVTVVPGKEEARLAALGILSSIHNAEGMVGDLGGGSLELVALRDQAAYQQTTLPLGLFRLMDACTDVAGMREKVIESLENVPWIRNEKPTVFYAIGGSFRALAKLHMLETHYPLEVVHQYTAPAKEMRDLLDRLMTLDIHAIENLPGVAAKRAHEILPAAAVMHALLHTGNVTRIVFSASGIREGFLYDLLPKKERAQDSLLAGCKDLAEQSGHPKGYGEEIFQWMTPLFPEESDELRRLRLAACMLSEIGWRVHAEYRGAESFHRVLHSSLTGIAHDERVALSLALYHRHQYRLKDRWQVASLADTEWQAWAKTVGTALNLAYHISGGVEGTLLKTALKIEKKQIVLELPKKLHALAGETLRKRVDGLGEAWSASASRTR